MAAKIFSAALLFAAGAIAAGPSAGSDAYGKYRLVASLKGPALSNTPPVDGLEVGFTGTGDETGIASLVAAGTGGVSRLDGETGLELLDFACGGGGAGKWSVHPGGTATVPAPNAVTLGCGGAGSRGFSVVPDPAGSLGSLLIFPGGSWVACRGDALGFGTDVIPLSFINDGQRPLEHCQPIFLVSQYLGSS